MNGHPYLVYCNILYCLMIIKKNYKQLILPSIFCAQCNYVLQNFYIKFDPQKASLILQKQKIPDKIINNFNNFKSNLYH